MLDDIIELVLEIFLDIIVEIFPTVKIPRTLKIFLTCVILIALFGGSGLLIGFGMVNQTTWMLVLGIALLIATTIWLVYLVSKYRIEMQKYNQW